MSAHACAVQHASEALAAGSDGMSFDWQPSQSALPTKRLQAESENESARGRGLQLTDEEVQALREHLLSSKSTRPNCYLLSCSFLSIAKALGTVPLQIITLGMETR